jgi:hypothetical protein
LVISIQSGATDQAVIDATGFSGTGLGPTYAFYIDTSRVIFNGIVFKGFQSSAIKGRNADIQFVNCGWVDNLQAGSYEEACGVVIDGGSITLPSSGVGHIGTGGTSISATSVNMLLETSPAALNTAPFFVVERGSNLTLMTHGVSGLQENLPQVSPFIIVAQAELNSSVVVTADFQTWGSCVLEANSVLAQTVQTNSFLGGVIADVTSSTVTQL